MEENEEIWHLTQVVLNDDQISFKAKGLFIFIVLANEKKGLTLKMIQQKSKDTERSITIGINELEKRGYVVRTKLVNEEVRWTYHLKKDVTHDTVIETKGSDEKRQPQRKKSKRKSNNRKRSVTKKSSLNKALSNFIKEFF